MLSFFPKLDDERPLRVLCLGAHSDDIEIGCGGTLFQLMTENRQLDVRWHVFSGNQMRAGEAQQSAEYWLESVEQKRILLHEFQDGFFPNEWGLIKEEFEQIKSSFEPDLIFTHYVDDAHQDHRVINELTWNTFRNHSIFEYEIPKYDGDLKTPNFYIPLTVETANRKSAALMRYFTSQGAKHWFCEELFLGLMRLRGMECCSSSGYAEGIHARKMILGS